MAQQNSFRNSKWIQGGVFYPVKSLTPGVFFVRFVYFFSPLHLFSEWDDSMAVYMKQDAIDLNFLFRLVTLWEFIFYLEGLQLLVPFFA